MILIRVFGRNFPLGGKEKISSGIAGVDPEFLKFILTKETLPKLGFKKNQEVDMYFVEGNGDKVKLDSSEAYEKAIRAGNLAGGTLSIYIDHDL